MMDVKEILDSTQKGETVAVKAVGTTKECSTEYPHPYLVVSLLDGCNKACKHCYRTAIPSEHGFKLKKYESMLCLDDASSLKTACILAGGEPTIWNDQDADFSSLLVEAAKRNGRAAFLSNGHVFEDRGYTDRFVQSYKEGCELPLLMMFSVDFIHENYEAKTKRIPFLDNLLAARYSYDIERLISFLIVSHWTNDQRQNIPLDVFEEYAKRGVQYKIDDFMTWGRGVGIEELACYVEVGSKDKTGLGPYGEILSTKMIVSGMVRDKDEFDSIENKDLLRKLSVCGYAPNFTISWGRKYYYCIPQMGYDWFLISELGELDIVSFEEFFDSRPVIKEIQEASIFGVIEKHKDMIDVNVLDEIQTMRESIRFAGCSICLRLSKEGILQKINQKLSSEKT